MEWTAVEKLTPTGIQSLDHFVCSESPYRLSYLGPRLARVHFINTGDKLMKNKDFCFDSSHPVVFCDNIVN
jgi:hypothetical protein